jgi:3-dehydroquinate dehydratase II
VKILVLHGPNLNLLGVREVGIYGELSLIDINEKLLNRAQDHELTIFQSNAEHELIEAVHKAMRDEVAGIIINPAAFTHTSIALRDAFLASKIPFIEVHLSNIFAREPFRQTSYFSDIAQGVISGFGAEGYMAALNLLIQQIESE